MAITKTVVIARCRPRPKGRKHMAQSESLINLSETGWIDADLSRRLHSIARLADLSGPVVCLPDIHVKRGMEAPSSLATAFDRAIVPGLSSCSLNCGMGAVAANITRQDLTPARLREFFRSFRDSARATDWDLSSDEVVEVSRRGFPAVAAKYGFDERSTDRVENGGRLGEPLERKTVEDLLDGAPTRLLKRWQVRLGLSIGGNHFVEFQEVTQVHDSRVASQWGLSEGRILVMYHGGGGPLAGFMGRYFGNRTKDELAKRARLFVKKVRYHFGEPGSVRGLPTRIKYFSPRAFVRHAVDTIEGHRLLASINVGMNYGYAYRLAIASRIARGLQATFGGSDAPDLVYDLSHNSIQRQQIRGRESWIHRHNANRIDSGAPLFLPGMYNSTSYVAIGAESADRFLCSAPHGLGELVSRDERDGTSTRLSDQTLRVDGTSDEFAAIPHIHSPRMLTAVERLEAEGLLRRVVELKPIAVLKNFHG
jgi:tRNA-splicing ligase RtcB (3'-phosphate/5'-hydroxy nucleic acid ligase)